VAAALKLPPWVKQMLKSPRPGHDPQPWSPHLGRFQHPIKGRNLAAISLL
jgi:hypothetical protein